MKELVSHLKPATNSLKRSIQRKMMEWESGCLSAARSSRDIMAVSGPSLMRGQVPPFRFLFLADQRASRARLRSEQLPTRRTKQVRIAACSARLENPSNYSKENAHHWRHRSRRLRPRIRPRLLPAAALAGTSVSMRTKFSGGAPGV